MDDQLNVLQHEMLRAQRDVADAQSRVADAQERVFSTNMCLLDCAITEAQERLEQCLDDLAAANRHVEYMRRQIVRRHAELTVSENGYSLGEFAGLLFAALIVAMIFVAWLCL